MRVIWGKGTDASGARRRASAWVRTGCVGLAVLLGGAIRATGADLGDARKLFDTGKYEQCVAACDQGIAPPATDPLAGIVLGAPSAGEDWWVLKARAQMQLGRYEDAVKTTGAGLGKNQENLSLALLRYQAFQMTGEDAEAKALLAQVQKLVTDTPWHFYDTENRVAWGRLMLLRGTDARQVLETYFDKARKDEPGSRSALLAIGELALAKNDPGVALEAIEAARKAFPENPDVYLDLARANDDDPETASAALEKALEINPRHSESLLMLVDNLIDRERYPEAAETLAKVLEVNPKEPRAWAYRAVLAHLQGDPKEEAADRATALSTWKSNPEVDYLIGKKLAQKYRFDAGTSYQKKALAFAADYEPARFELCQDLLRTGNEDEGWKLAAAVFKDDPYNVEAYNLVTLHDHLAKFKTLANAHFVVRMDATEAPVYGQRVLDLLSRAHETFCAKYGVELAEPTTVELFPQQQDFAIRTFGFPGEEGFLGVCFGRVVTVNSPASRLAHPSSWEAVVWHEFCHTVTLTKTHNKMPRWISEGISVYEERQANGAWGDHMLPAYRELIEKGGGRKIGELSQAFAMPPSPMHLQFAYFEASMVVEYVVHRFGMEALKGVLTDLGDDVAINEALARHAEPMDKLEEDFATWFKGQADQLAPKVNWEEPKLLPEDGSGALAAWNKEHADSFWGLIDEGEALLLERKYEEAKVLLNKAAALFPGYAEDDGPYLLLAKAHRELQETKEERDVLMKFAALNADVVVPRLRLLELAEADHDWKTLRSESEKVLGVDPMTPLPYRYLAESAEALGDRATAIAARQTLLRMDPLDKPEQHYRLAKLLYEEGKLAEARREVDLSLEDAPRFRDALGLLLEIAGKMDAASGAAGVDGARRAPAMAPTTATSPAGDERLPEEPQP